MPKSGTNSNSEVPWILRDLNIEIRRDVDNIPAVIREFYFDQNIQKASFRGELYHLRKKLIAERHKKYHKEKEFYRLLYIGLCDYYLGANKYAVSFLDMAMDLNVCDEIYPLILQIKYSIVKLPKILLIVSYEEKYSYNYLRLQDIDRSIEVCMPDDFETIEDMLMMWNEYDQVFLIGHGEDEGEETSAYLEINGLEFKPQDLVNYLNSNGETPKILGVFSCGTGFDIPEIKNRFDYFLTDNTSSVPEFIEMFFNGFLTEYYYSFNIKTSFEKGKLATLFRAVSDPSYKIYAHGIPLQ